MAVHKISSILSLIVLGLSQALLECVAVLWWQSSAASVSSQNVNASVIVAVDDVVPIAVGLELKHVVLDSASGTQRLVHAVLKGTGIVSMVSGLHRLGGIGPVGAGDAEQATNFTVAGQSLVAVAHGLADASQADIGNRGSTGRLILRDGGQRLLGLDLLELLRVELLLQGSGGELLSQWSSTKLHSGEGLLNGSREETDSGESLELLLLLLGSELWLILGQSSLR